MASAFSAVAYPLSLQIGANHGTRKLISNSSFSVSAITNKFPCLRISMPSPLFSGISTTNQRRGNSHRGVFVVAAAKPDSAAKRARQAVKRRMYNRSRKSEIRTRMKKVLEALDKLKKVPSPSEDDILPIEKLIAEAYSTIDKAVKVGTVHRNTGARRKSRLARRKKAVLIHHGWYNPSLVA